MSKPDPRATARNRLRLVAGADPAKVANRQWYRFANKGTDGVTDVYLYGEIGDSWFGDSVSAADFVRELKGVKSERIRLHLHSPGGDVWDGLAILNALRQHPAKVTTIVDGIAASAASVVAMGGEEVVMMDNAELMIHDALGLAMGNAALMRDMASDLDRESDNIAAVYAAKAGGDVADWRAAMRAESWYSPAEALEAGLIDRIQEGGDDELSEDAIVLGSKDGGGFFDALPYRYAARAEAPSPPIPSHPDASHGTVSDNRDDSGAGEASVDLTELRQALDLGDDVSDDDVIAAAVAKANEAPEDTGDEDKVTVPEGAVVVDATTLDQLKADAAEGRAAAQAIRAQNRQAFIASVIAAGKLAPANTDLRETLEREWDADPERAQRVANSLAVVANMSEAGHGRNADRPDLDSKWDDWEAAAIPELRKVRANGGSANA